jgi:oxalate decarboxylase
MTRAAQAPECARTAPPPTDAGGVPNLRFAFADARLRVEDGGWAREVTERELPAATSLAGVNMALEPGAVRELHWHKQAEWAYMLTGGARITALDPDGHASVEDVGPSDLWFFGPGVPHSIQGLGEGCEFLLVFDDGGFSEDATFLLCDWLAHTPREVVARSLRVSEHELHGLPDGERYIFPAAVPAVPPVEQPVGPAGAPARPPVFRLLAEDPVRLPGGCVRIADAANFPVTTIAAALVDLEPGALRELHWHPNAAEWQYYVKGRGRMTVFAAEGRARTFEVAAGDVGYVPFAMGHHVENTGDEPLRFLEVFRSERFADVSLAQWLALTPPTLVREHLGVGDGVLRALPSAKRPVVP